MKRWRVSCALVMCTAACAAPAPPSSSAARPTAAPAARALPVDAALVAAAATYRAHKTLANLEEVAARLQPGMARADVERLLGDADGWDDPSVFYASDRANDAGERLGLTVEFYLWYTDGRPSTPSDRLERWLLGSGNRFEGADPKIPKRGPPRDTAGARVALEAMASHYRRDRDYASLQALVAGLSLGLPRPDVEALLGPPAQCAEDGLPCYYPSDRKNAAGLPLTVSVDYRVNNVDAPGARVSDRLEAVTFGPVAPPRTGH